MTKLYTFTDINEQPYYLGGLKTSFNRVILDDEIEGFQTLTVAGREIISDRLTTVDNIPGRDGSLVMNTTTEPRLLTVKYRLQAKDSEDLLARFKQLGQILRMNKGEANEIYFSDSPESLFYGYFQEASEINPATNDVVGELVFFCADPYIYSLTRKISGKDLIIGYFCKDPINPDEIAINVTVNTAAIQVRNMTTGRMITLKGSYSIGDKIVIRIRDEKDKITKNGTNIMNNLILESDFIDFTVKPKDRVYCANGTMEIKIRDRWK